MSHQTGYFTTVLPAHTMALIPRMMLRRLSQAMIESVATLRAFHCNGNGISIRMTQIKETIGSSILIVSARGGWMRVRWKDSEVKAHINMLPSTKCKQSKVVDQED